MTLLDLSDEFDEAEEYLRKKDSEEAQIIINSKKFNWKIIKFSY